VVLAGPWFGVPREQRESIAQMWKSEPRERKRYALAKIQQRLQDDATITQAQMALILRHDLVLDASPWRAFARWSSVGFRTLEDTEEEQPLLKDADTLAVFLANPSGEPPAVGFLRGMLLRALQLPSGYRAADRLRPSLPVDGIALEGCIRSRYDLLTPESCDKNSPLPTFLLSVGDSSRQLVPWASSAFSETLDRLRGSSR
jgi:hypothetical protein